MYALQEASGTRMHVQSDNGWVSIQTSKVCINVCCSANNALYENPKLQLQDNPSYGTAITSTERVEDVDVAYETCNL